MGRKEGREGGTKITRYRRDLSSSLHGLSIRCFFEWDSSVRGVLNGPRACTKRCGLKSRIRGAREGGEEWRNIEGVRRRRRKKQKEERKKGTERAKGVRYAISRVAVGKVGSRKVYGKRGRKRWWSKGVCGGWGWETGVPDDPMARHVWGPQTAGPDS